MLQKHCTQCHPGAPTNVGEPRISPTARTFQSSCYHIHTVGEILDKIFLIEKFFQDDAPLLPNPPFTTYNVNNPRKTEFG